MMLSQDLDHNSEKQLCRKGVPDRVILGPQHLLFASESEEELGVQFSGQAFA